MRAALGTTVSMIVLVVGCGSGGGPGGGSGPSHCVELAGACHCDDSVYDAGLAHCSEATVSTTRGVRCRRGVDCDCEPVSCGIDNGHCTCGSLLPPFAGRHDVVRRHRVDVLYERHALLLVRRRL